MEALLRWPATPGAGEPRVYIVGPRRAGKTTLATRLVQGFIEAGRLPAGTLQFNLYEEPEVTAHNGDCAVHEVEYVRTIPALDGNAYVVLLPGALPASCDWARCVPVDRARPLLAALTGYQALLYDVAQDAFHVYGA